MLWHNCSRTADWSARQCLAGQLIVAHNLNSRYITAVVLWSLPATMCSPLLLGCHYSLLHVFTRLVWLLHELARAGFKISPSDFFTGSRIVRVPVQAGGRPVNWCFLRSYNSWEYVILSFKRGNINLGWGLTVLFRGAKKFTRVYLSSYFLRTPKKIAHEIFVFVY